jgi:HK97 family phage major capsid protein
MTIRELLEKRANLISQARAILDKADAEKRDLIPEEQTQWDTLMNDADKLQRRVEQEERQARLEAGLEDSRNRPIHTQDGQPAGNPPSQEESERRMAAFRRILPAWITRDFRGIPETEYRALQADLDVSGGYLRPPQEFINMLLKNVDDIVFIRRMATTYTVVSADSMGVPTLEADPADADWTTELATGSEDGNMSFGKRELKPNPLAKRIKVSRKLLRAVPNSEELVRGRLAYKFGITQEKAYMTGTGHNQPLGVFVASNDGIPTTRDVSTGNTTAAPTFDGLKEAKYTLKGAYWPKAQWVFHRDCVKLIAKIKTDFGYIWAESVRVGEPDRLLGLPVNMSEYAPNTFSASQYVGILGDFSNYWIADALTLEFQMLMELYAESNQVGLIGRLESDAMPVLSEAFVRVKLAAG